MIPRSDENTRTDDQLAPTASVVIATFNRPEFVRRCLQHLAEQTRPPREVVVVDASLDDRTRHVVAEFPSAGYLRNERGPGSTATSRAIGLAATTGDVVAFLDDDAFAEPTWLAELVSRYGDPRVAAVGGRARNGQPGEETEGLDEIGLFLPNGRLTGNFAADPGGDVDVDHLLGANMSVRRDVVEALGGIHDHYPGTCLREETDIALRMRRAGYRIVYAPSAVVEHVAGPYARGRRFDTRYKYYGARNHVVLLGRTVGLGDPRTRRYVKSAVLEIAADLKASAMAIGNPEKGTMTLKVRGIAGGVLRAAAKTAGLTVGLGEALALRLRVGPV